MSSAESNRTNELALTDEHRMLLQMRDTLYEGNWQDFVHDLRERATGQPHVFDTIPDTPGLRRTIAHHLGLIAEMRNWEDVHKRLLSPRDP